MKLHFKAAMIFMCMFYSSNLLAWEVNTHRAIDRCAISNECSNDGRKRAKNLHQFVDSIQDITTGIKNERGYLNQEEYFDQVFDGYLLNGRSVPYFSYAVSQAMFPWEQEFDDFKYNNLIEAGTILEDSLYPDINSGEVNVGGDGYGRFLNHFYDPQHNGRELDMSFGGAKASAVDWALKSINVGKNNNIRNNYNYPSALEYFKLGFSSKTVSERRKNRAKMFVSLGFLMHLLNDMNVPAHTRDNAHPWDDYLERWARGGAKPGNDPDGFRIRGSILDGRNSQSIMNEIVKKEFSKYGYANDFYTSEANFTGYNFFSDGPTGVPRNTGSIFKESFAPTIDGVGVNVPSKGGYITSNNSELGGYDKLAIQTYEDCTFCFSKTKKVMRVDGDNSVLQDNAINLIPRAVANAEGFINYFFRLQMLAVIEDGKLKIANISDKNLVGKDSLDASFATTFLGKGTISVYQDDASGTRTLVFGPESLKDDLLSSDMFGRIRAFDLPERLRNLSYEEAKKFTVVYEGGTLGDTGAIAATTVDPKRDFDEDGMPDFWEVEHHLDINEDDSTDDFDHDGLINFKEYKAGTLPDNQDTDGDSFTDKQEVDAGTDPLDKTKHPVTLTAPIVTATPSDKQVTLSWGAIQGATGGYAYCYSKVSADCATYNSATWKKVESGTSVVISELDNGTPYHFRVVAKDSNGVVSPVSGEEKATPAKESINDFTNLDPEVEDSTLNVGIDTKDGTLKLSFKDDGTTSQTFPYIWIANSGEGTISKLDVKTGQELGRYRTGPSNGNPSRTTVDQDGNVWVGNRNNNTITKVGLKEFGQCIDRNGNGDIDTSTGSTDVKPWGGYLGDGQGITNAQDECVLQHVTLSAPGISTPSDIRMVAIDKDNNVFTGGHYVKSIYKVNGKTGEIIGAANTQGSFYGGFVDKDGNLWATHRSDGYGVIIKVSNDLQSQNIYNVGLNAYGMALNKHGEIWVSDAGSPNFSSFNVTDPAGTLKIHQQVGRGWQSCYAQGVAIDGNDDIFIAGCRDSYDSVVGHYKRVMGESGVTVQHVANYPVGQGPTGVAVDGNGHVWSANEYGNSASKITLATATASYNVETFPVGYRPYNYSDMTGRVVRTITSRQGTWEATFDSKADQYAWKQIRWKLLGNALPAGTSVTVSAKTADNINDLNGKNYVDVENGVDEPKLGAGRYLKLKVKLTSDDLTSTPEVIELQLY